MSVNLWKDSKRNEAQELIDLLLKARTENGWPTNLENDIGLAELAASASPRLSWTMVMRVLSKMSQQHTTTTGDFESTYSQIRDDDAKAGGRPVTWSFFIPLKLTLNADLPTPLEITILDKHFTFLTKEAVEQRLDETTNSILRDPTLLKRHARTQEEQSLSVFLCVDQQATEWALAWAGVASAFDTFRGLFELSFGFGEWQVSDRGKAPRRKVPHPRWMLAQKATGEVEWGYFVTDEVEADKTFELTAQHFGVIQKNSEFLVTEPNPSSSLSILADCLRLYAQAMDAGFRHECFLGLWQLAEAIALSESIRGDTNAVNNRLTWHGKRVGLKGSGYRETLRALADKRNDIVHRGMADVDDEDINVLKFICEIALNWLFFIHKQLPTAQHLEHFYRLRDVNSSELEAIQDCVEYMKQQRSK